MLNKIKIDKDQIKLVALSARLEFDDEALSIIVMGSNNKKQEIKFQYLTIPQKEIKQFENFFNLENTIGEEWSKFSYDDHQNYEVKVIYPKELYWSNLLEKSIFNRLFKILKFLRIIPVSSGLLNSEVKQYLDKNER